MKKHRAVCIGIGILSILLVGGCSSHIHRLMEPRSLFYEGRLDEAHEKLDKLTKSAKRDRDVVQLDLAMVELLNGQPRSAEQRLRAVRDRFDELEQANVAESTLALWTDDQRRSYAGEDYEKVLIRTFLAIANLMQDGGDAEAYALQVNEKQRELSERAAERVGKVFADRYQPLPFGYYLHGMLREATYTNYDDAARSYQRTAELLPNTLPIQWDITRATQGVHAASGNGVLYVIALVGRGPYKIEATEDATSDALLVADRIVSVLGEYSIPPTLAPIKVPAIEVPPMGIEAVGVTVDDQSIGPTFCVADLGALASSTFETKRTELMARAVARRVVKKATVYAAKDTLSANNQLVSFAMDAAGVAWEATESADTRCWGMLPREIQILRVELPRGSHEIGLHPLLNSRSINNASSTKVTIVDGRNTVLLCCFPDSRPIGRPASSP